MNIIAGRIDYSVDMKNEIVTLDQMLKTPRSDGGGLYIDDCAALISGENKIQPLTIKSHMEEYTLVFTGQIYNKEDISNQLFELGYVFKEKSDTELVLYSYIEWGRGCLTKFNGVFALAIWAKNAKELFLARDRIGVKPLFFYRYKEGILFGSLIKTLLACRIVKKEVDRYGLKQLLLLGPARSIGCGVIKGLQELKPGEYLTYNKDGLKVNSYWSFVATKHIDNLETTIEKTRNLTIDAINRQLDAPCGLSCMLSGGLDSSIISMVAAKYLAKKNVTLDTYSVDYEDNEKYFEQNSFQPSQDNIYIDMMVDFIGSHHKYEVLDNIEVAKSIIDAADARDLPGMGDIDSSLLLFLKEIAKEHKVCVSGECADEILGGYPWYHNDELLYKNTFPWSDATDMRKKLFAGADFGDDAQEFVQNEYKKTVKYTDYLDTDSNKNRRIREMFMLNFNWFMQTLLERSDRMSVYAGIEVRVPLCDYHLAEYAFNMPWEFKALYGREKGILREAFKDLLPKDIVFRKKNPYPKTYNPVFNKYVETKAQSLIGYKGSILSHLVDKNFFNDLKENRVVLKSPWYGQLMRTPQIFAYLIQLDFFFRKYNLTLV
ncbi:MAG TPA: asparagine synthase (glutamine-hydrolyzing) [Clostridia bacterium]|nr:asparagine synthase (glutamine-hydrolyzing) [Clostridia bacterium]